MILTMSPEKHRVFVRAESIASIMEAAEGARIILRNKLGITVSQTFDEMMSLMVAEANISDGEPY